MSESNQLVASISITFRADLLRRAPQLTPDVWSNAFACINDPSTPQNWPIRDIFMVKEYPPEIQPKVYQTTVGSKFRDSIMSHAEQLERSKQVPKNAVIGNGTSKKRKSPEVTVEVSPKSEEPLIKRLKTVKPNVTDSTNTKSRYVIKDHSSRLIQLGREEMAKQEVAKAENSTKEEVKAYMATQTGTPPDTTAGSRCDGSLSQRAQEDIDKASKVAQADSRSDLSAGPRIEDELSQETIDETTTAIISPPNQYRIKNHANRLIAAGIDELAAHPNADTVLTCEDYETSVNGNVDSTKHVDALVYVDDLDDSFFEDASLEAVFDQATSTDATVFTEMDDLDDSIFDQLIADDEADWEQALISVQPEITCSSSDTLSSLAKPGLMLPPKLPSSATPLEAPSKAKTQTKAIIPNSPLSPFLRPMPSTLVTVPSAISNLKPEGRIPTCFRIAELLRELSSASPSAAIELFATVTASARNRDSTSQSFTFADLFFPQRPPYIQGTYAKCSESELFDDDTRPFLRAGQGDRTILARVIITAKVRTGKQLVWNQKNGFYAAEEASTGTEMEILSVYVCSQEDIEHTKGIVMPEEELQIKKEEEKEVFYKPERKRKFEALKPLNQQSTALNDISSNLPSSPTVMTDNRK